MLNIELDKPGDPHWLSKPKVKKYDESEPRDASGKWTAGGGSGAAPKTPGEAPAGGGSADEVHTDDIEVAAKALGEGKKVVLSQPRQVSTLLDRLAVISKEAEARGEKAPNYDLCNVSVPGTNLFCLESKGIPRIKMPQLSGKPLPGSPADSLPKNAKGEVNIAGAFLDHLKSLGVPVDNTTELADHLRATQNELNGVKIGGMMGAMRAGKLAPEPIFVSSDNYVVDGHHRWAANVGLDLESPTDKPVTMPVHRVHMGIIPLLALSHSYAAQQGLPVAGFKRAAWMFKYDESELRDASGKWTSGGGASADTLAERSLQHGGLSYNPRTGEEPKEGFAIAVHVDRTKVIDHDPTPDEIGGYLKDNADVFKKDPSSHLGIWKNPTTGETHMSISAVLSDKDRALDLARQTHQLAVYDLGAGKDIRTADVGEKPHPLDVIIPEGVPKLDFKPGTTPEEFIAIRDQNPRKDFLSHLEPGDLKDHKLILSADGNAGAAVAPNGDIQNVFRNPGAPKGAGTAATLEAVKRGGLMLDCYDYDRKDRPGLPDVYRKAGFVETGRMKFNPAYSIEHRPNWNPDVVFMAYVGGDQSTSPKATHYYQAHEWDRAKTDSLAHADAPGESSVGRQLREQNEARHAYKPKLPPFFKSESVTAGALKESIKIKNNKKRWGLRPHRFLVAMYTAGNGHPRCIRCGDEEPSDGLCMPELLKYASMIDKAFDVRIESQGEAALGNWIAQFHSKCIEKSAACAITWPVCPVGKSDVIAKYITGSNGSFKVHAESGKVLGTHATRGEAEAQLRAIEANKHNTEKIGWTDEARAAAIAARSEKAKQFADPTQNPFHKVLTAHGFKPKSSEAKVNQFARNDPRGDYTQHVYTHPEHGKTTVAVEQDHYPTEGAKAHRFVHRHEQSNGIIAPSTGDTKPQLDRSLTREYGAPTAKVEWPVTPDTADYGKPPIHGEKAPNAGPGQVAPNQKAVKALQVAFREYAKAEGIVVKIEEVMCESVEMMQAGTVYKIEYGTGRTFFIEKDGDVARLASYTQRKSAPVPVTKAEKQRYTLGVVYAPGEVDFHGDTMTETELEKAAWMYAQKDGLTARVGMMHQSGTEGAGKVVESYVYRGPVWKLKDVSGKEQTIVPGSWMLGVVWEPEAWKKVEDGKLTGYSLQGVARKFANGEEV